MWTTMTKIVYTRYRSNTVHRLWHGEAQLIVTCRPTRSEEIHRHLVKDWVLTVRKLDSRLPTGATVTGLPRTYPSYPYHFAPITYMTVNISMKGYYPKKSNDLVKNTSSKRISCSFKNNNLLCTSNATQWYHYPKYQNDNQEYPGYLKIDLMTRSQRI